MEEKIKVSLESLNQVIAQLTSRQREVIFLHFWEGFSYREIAELMDIPLKATYKLMARSIDIIFTGLDGGQVSGWK